jgi:hypothetical protein
MSSDTDNKRQIIAILTAMQDAPGGSEELSQLLQGIRLDFDSWIPVSATVGSPADLERLLRQVLRQATEQTTPQILDTLRYVLFLFNALAIEAKVACPDFDVQEFLRRRALELAEGE